MGRLDITPIDVPIKNSLPTMMKRYTQLPNNTPGTSTSATGVTTIASITDSQNLTGIGMLDSMKTEAVNIIDINRILTIK